MADSTLKVNIVAVDKASLALGKVASSAEKMGGRLQTAGLAAAAGIGLLAKASINAASDLSETASKADRVFGEAAGTVKEFADGAAKGLGQSKQQALDAATTFATFGKSAGLAGEDLAGFSTDFVTLASDMASFSNTTPQEAIEAIGAALRGEAEPIRKYGVLLDDATLKSEAMRLGLIKTTKEALTPQQKVLAAQAAIFKQTGDAQGDFERTSEGLANKQRILNAELENSKAKLGEGLLPAASTVVGVLADMAGVFAGLPTPVRNTAVGVALLGTAALIAAPRVVALQTALTNAGGVSGAAGKFKTGLSRAAGFLTGPWGIAVAGAVTVVGILAAKHMDGKRKIEAYTDAIKADSGALGENTRAAVINTLEKEGLLRKAQLLGISAEDLTDAVLGEKGALERVNDELGLYDTRLGVSTKAGVGAGGQAKKNAAAARDLRDAVAGGNAELSEAAEANKRTSAAMGDTAQKSGDAAEGIGDMTEAVEDGKTAIDQYSDAIEGLTGGFLDIDEARDRAKAAVADFTEGLKENGKSFSSNTEKGRANKEGLRQIAGSAKDAAEAVFKVVEPTKGVEVAQKQANAELEKGRERFIKAAMAAGKTKEKAKELADQYGLLPKGVTTKIKGDTAPAKAKVADFKTWAAKQNAVIPVSMKISKNAAALLAGTTPGSAASKRIAEDAIDGRLAKGGPVRAGGTYLVGEKGPELFMPSGSGMIIPNGGGGNPVGTGGVTVVVQTGQAISTKDDIARAVIDALRSSGSRGLKLA